MPTDKEIRLNVDDKALERLREKATKLGRDMVTASRQLSTSSTDVISDLREQIALMEKRNRLNEQAAQNQVKQARQAKQPVPQEARQAIAQAQENKTLTGLLREMIDSQKNISKGEIRANRDDVEKRIRSSKTANQLGPQGDPFEILQETLQSGYLGLPKKIAQEKKSEERAAKQEEKARVKAEKETEKVRLRAEREEEKARNKAIKEEEKSRIRSEKEEAKTENVRQAKRQRRQKALSRGVENVANRAAGAENEYTFLSGALEGIPVFGKALATVAARSIGAADEYEKALANYGLQQEYATKSLGMEVMTAPDRGRQAIAAYRGDYAVLGLTPSEGLNRDVAIRRELQRTVYADELHNIPAAQKVLQLDSNTINQILSVSRYDKGGDTNQVISTIDKHVRENTWHIGQLPELFQTWANTSNQILATRGSVDTADIASLVTHISKKTGFQGQQLNRVTGALGKVGQSRNPVVRAMLLRAFREVDPEGSYVDHLEKIEGGLTKESRPGFQRFFEILREGAGGGGDAHTLRLKAVLEDLGIQEIRKASATGIAGLLEPPDPDEKDKINYLKEVKDKKALGPIEKSGIEISTQLQFAGDALVSAIESIKTTISGALDDLAKFGPQGKPKPNPATSENNAATDDVTEE